MAVLWQFCREVILGQGRESRVRFAMSLVMPFAQILRMSRFVEHLELCWQGELLPL